ncbi:MAG: hypothetical protein RL380_447 [Verrucomicrobiota bacterium]|jgi:tetratricopeptide (TPR) repeat protein
MNPANSRLKFYAAALALLVVAAYLPVWHAGYVWDDDRYVTENPLLTATDGLWRIWFTPHVQSQYFPLVFTTLRLEHALWGLHPLGYHLVNVLFHTANALLAWTLLRRLAMPGAWLAAAVWALHPVQVESVAWVTELKNTESTFFYLTACLAWLRWLGKVESRKLKAEIKNTHTREAGFQLSNFNFQLLPYALALAACLLALFAKTTTCTLPAALVLLCWLRGEKFSWRRAGQILPFVAAGLALGLVSVWWEKHLGNYSVESGAEFSLPERALLAARALGFYAGKILWPWPLAFSYPKWHVSLRELSSWLWLMGVASAAVLAWLRRASLPRGVIAGLVFFTAALSPMLGLIWLYTFRYASAADHYQYLASLGLIAALVGIAVHHTRAWSENLRVGITVCLLLTLGALTWRQSEFYKNSYTLWTATLAVNPDSALAHGNLGLELFNRGQLATAEQHQREAVRLKPDYTEGWNNLGQVLDGRGDTTGALAAYERALALHANFAEPSVNLGGLLVRLGRRDEGIKHLRDALRRAPGLAEAHNNLAAALQAAGDYDGALASYREAARLRPDLGAIHHNLGSVFLDQRKLADAENEFELALKLNPNHAKSHAKLAHLLLLRGQKNLARPHLEAAVQLAPDDLDSHNSLAWLLATSDNHWPAVNAEALALAQRAVALTGGSHPAPLDTLAAACAHAGDFSAAISHAETALRLAETAGDTQLADQIRAHLVRFRAGQSLTE